VVHTLALAEALARAGQEVTVWALARGGDTGFFRPVDERVQIRAVPFPDLPDEAVEARVQRSIAVLSAAFAESLPGSRGYDVVHTQDCITANAVPGRIRTVHHLDQFGLPELAGYQERSLLEPCAHICPSGAVAAELAVVWGRGAVVIPNGVEAARFAAAAGNDSEAVARRRYWTDRFGDFVLAVGGIEPRKGTVDLIRAMARVRRRRPGTRLVIAGGDTLLDHREYRQEVQALAVRLRIEPEVLGPVEHDQLPGLVAAAAVFALGSAQEGFGLAAMEALAAGVPVVARDLPVFREEFADTVRYAYAGDGSGAEVAAGLAAGLVAALEQPADASTRAVREAGQLLAASHSWDDVASAHLEYYAALISEGRPVGQTVRSL
jgi:glycosyltransferase-like protein